MSPETIFTEKCYPKSFGSGTDSQGFCYPGTARRSNGGFTIVEVLITLLICVMGFLTIGQINSASMKGNGKANRLTLANLLAENTAEALLSLPFNDSGLDEGVHGPNANDRYWIGWKVTDDVPLAPISLDTNGNEIPPITRSKTIEIVVFNNTNAFNDNQGSNRILSLNIIKTRSI